MPSRTVLGLRLGSAVGHPDPCLEALFRSEPAGLGLAVEHSLAHVVRIGLIKNIPPG